MTTTTTTTTTTSTLTSTGLAGPVPYDAVRDHRFDDLAAAAEHIERAQCVRGCVHAIDPQPDMPGGSCDVLAHIVCLGGRVVGVLGTGPDVLDHGTHLECTRHTPPPTTPDPGPAPSQAGQLDILTRPHLDRHRDR